MFDLPHERVHSVVSRMIARCELHGALDTESNHILIYASALENVQNAASDFADKVSTYITTSGKLTDHQKLCVNQKV